VYLAKEKADARAKELEEAAAEAERVQEVPDPPAYCGFVGRQSVTHTGYPMWIPIKLV